MGSSPICRTKEKDHPNGWSFSLAFETGELEAALENSSVDCFSAAGK